MSPNESLSPCQIVTKPKTRCSHPVRPSHAYDRCELFRDVFPISFQKTYPSLWGFLFFLFTVYQSRAMSGSTCGQWDPWASLSVVTQSQIRAVYDRRLKPPASAARLLCVAPTPVCPGHLIRKRLAARKRPPHSEPSAAADACSAGAVQIRKWPFGQSPGTRTFARQILRRSICTS